MPDREGRAGDVVLGFPDLDGYLAHPEPFLGALIGRYANRIAGARFPLDGVTYALAPNNGPNSLHGGERGFDKRVWDVTAVGHGLRLTRVSPHGEEGFPGRLEVSVTYTLDERGALGIAYEAVTDAPTPVNPTNHSYWNLAGSGSAAGHELRVAASRFTPVDADLIPTGELADVTGTRFDLRAGGPPGDLDHPFVVRGCETGWTPGGPLHEVARLRGHGLALTVAADQPGVQVYSGGAFSGRFLQPFAGVAIEPQLHPDSPHHEGEPGWPSAVLRPGETYRWTQEVDVETDVEIDPAGPR